MRRGVIGCLAAAFLALSAPLALAATTPVAPDSAVCREVGTPVPDPPPALTVTSSEPWAPPHAPPDGRITEYDFANSLAGAGTRAFVILPNGYDPARASAYPVLYLLHGHGGQGPLDWLINGNAESIVDASPHPDLIVVIPDGGYDGWYSDWYGRDQYDPSTAPPPAWETFHIGQLIPWVDSTFHTLDGRAGRAIAGLSMGGFGSMSYAARHPDLFAAAGSFSGAVNTDIDWPVGSTAELAAANLPDGQRPDNCIWGDPVTQHDVWQAHNPTSRAASLAGVSLYIASGDGTPGPADLSKQPQSLAGQAASEAGIRMMNEQFIDALNQAGVAHTANLYSPGVHDWPYWRTDLANFLAWLVLPSA